MKHISRCAKSTAPKTYSFRGRGRPRNNTDSEEMIPAIVRDCSNCGADCVSRKDICSRWTPMEPKVCPFCGHDPRKVYENGVMTEIRCN